jgi:hypothetical protein
MNSANEKMQECANKKVDAINRWYFYKEAELLHLYTHTYTKTRFEYANGGNPLFNEIFEERDRLIKERVATAEKITKVEKEIQSAYKKEKANLTPVKPGQLPTNVTTVSGGFYTKEVFTNKSLIDKQAELRSYVTQYNNLTTQIKSENKKFTQELEKLNEGLLATIKLLLSNPFALAQPLKTKIATIRSNALSSNKNPISNMQGFDDRGRLFIYVHDLILNEANEIAGGSKSKYKSYVSKAPKEGVRVLSGLNSDTFSTYFRKTPLDFEPGTPEPPRKGLLEEGVWKKYYSANRLDNLFSWQEQGYTSPKPEYDQNGKAKGATQKVKIVNGEGKTIIQKVPTTVKDCQVNLQVSIPFLENIVTNTKAKIISLSESIINGKVSQDYLKRIEIVATLESRLYFGDLMSKITFNDSINELNYTMPEEFERDYKITSRIYESLQKKLVDIDAEIAKYDSCINEQEKAVEQAAKEYGDKCGTKDKRKSKNSANVEKNCKKKLGTDPIGITPSECPNYTKNCYWKEYTKLLQIVSLMPIPETEELFLRLFRYYPVALQFPIPAPPGVLPSLASGIPDPLISIPMPFLWKHVLTVQTPVGLFVVWIAMAGGIVPNPFVMMIDERMQSSFIVNPRGIPTPIPARILKVTDLEKLSLAELIPAFDLLRVDLSTPIGKFIQGSTRLNANNPDSSDTVIDRIKNKIKKSVDDIEIPNPSFSVDTERVEQLRRLLKRICNGLSVDTSIFSQVFDEMSSSVETAVDLINISTVKIPKNSKYMMAELPAAVEMLETFSQLVNNAKNAPSAAAEKILGEIGASIKMVDVKEKINGLARQEIDRTGAKEALARVDEEIDRAEAAIPDLNGLSAELKTEIIEKRAEIVKKAVIIPIEKAAERITPELLGYVSIPELPIVLPEPCYSNISIPTVPPYILAAIEFIKKIPSLINNFANDLIAKIVAPFIDLSKPLPSAEVVFQLCLNAILGLLPDLVLPAGFNENLLAMIRKSIQDFLLLFKVRLPKPGLPMQLIIVGQQIKAVIKTVIRTLLQKLKEILMNYLQKIINATGLDRLAMCFAFNSICNCMFGVSLDRLSGVDIKAFFMRLIESVAFPALDFLNKIIAAATSISAPFKSMMQLFTLPDLAMFPPFKKDGPLYEIGSKQIREIIDPLLQKVPQIASALPFPVILLAASVTPSRIALSKLHPTKANEKLPTWEALTLRNIPFTLWLDQFVATAQRASLLGSNYLVPYFTPLTP